MQQLKSNIYQKALRYSLGLLSKKRYSEGEIRDKLNKYFERLPKKDEKLASFLSEGGSLDFEEIEGRIIERLTELKYLDDWQYIKDFIAERVRYKPRGEFMIRRELSKKKIARRLIENFFEEKENQINEEEMANQLLEKKMRIWKSLDKYKFKTKAARFLASKGFKSEVIYNVINNCYNQVADES